MRITLNGTLKDIFNLKELTNGNSVVSLLLQSETGGQWPNKFMLSAFLNADKNGFVLSDLEFFLGKTVEAECYLNGKQFVNGEKKFYNELKLINLK